MWTDAAALLLATNVIANAVRSLSCFLDNAHTISAVLGWSKGVCAICILQFAVLQVAAVTALLVPSVYNAVGSVRPAALLVVSVWAEALFMQDLGQPLFVLRCACLAMSAGCLGLFRIDQATRSAQLQLPTEDWQLLLEKSTRRFCTRAACGVHCPVAGAALLASFTFRKHAPARGTKRARD